MEVGNSKQKTIGKELNNKKGEFNNSPFYYSEIFLL